MKTKVEIAGYEIEIEEKDGLIMVKAEKDDEIVEEFTIETEEFEGGEGAAQGEEEVQGFGDFDGGSDEEGDFEGGEEELEDEDEPKLESFQSFVNKIKKFNESVNDFLEMEMKFNRIKISYTGDPESLYLIIYDGYDDFLSHDIYYKVKDKKEGRKLFKEEKEKSSIINGGNIYTYKEVFNMYKDIDKILKGQDTLDKWIIKENNMLNKFDFKVEEI
jgi:hypothetical protein